MIFSVVDSHCHLAVLFSHLKVTTMEEVKVYSEGSWYSEQPFMMQVVYNMVCQVCRAHLVNQLMMQEILPNTYYATSYHPPGSSRGGCRVPAHHGCRSESRGLGGV